MWTQALKINMGKPFLNVLWIAHMWAQNLTDFSDGLGYFHGGVPGQVLRHPSTCPTSEVFPFRHELVPIVQGEDFLGQPLNHQQMLLNAVGTAFVGVLKVVFYQ